MKFTTVLSVFMAVAGHTLAAALPTTGTEAAKGAFSAIFYDTINKQVFCEWVDQDQIGDTGSNYSIEADCIRLASIVRARHGHWEVKHWNTASAEEILENGTCHLRISRTDGGTGRVWIGNQDVGHFIGLATNLAHRGLMGVLGAMTCSHPDGDSVQIAISVMA